MNRQLIPSYWEQTTFLAPYDLIIVGSGIVGSIAALHSIALQQALRIAIVDRGPIPAGASTRNAGFACFGSISEICADIANQGRDSALALVARRRRGLERLFSYIPPSLMDYKASGGYEIFLEEDDERYMACMREIEALNTDLSPLFGGPCFIPDDESAGKMGLQGIAHVVRHPYEGVLNPGKMMVHLHKTLHNAGIDLLNGVTIAGITDRADGARLRCDNGWTLEARGVLVCTNGFARQLLPDLAVTPARNQVYVTQRIEGLRLSGCFHYNQGYVYFREIDGRVLIGGARNLDFAGEVTVEFGLTEHIRDYLTEFLSRHILAGHAFHFEHAWSGIMGLGREKTPLIGMAGERVGVAVRLGGMGIAIGSLVGEEAAEMLLMKI